MSSDAHTYERGRFYIGPNGFPRFAGSSSGVYLAGTLSSELSPAQPFNAGIDDVYINRNNDIEPRKDEVSHYSQFTLQAADLKHHERIRQALKRYFAVWHPLFPFLDGAYLISSFDSAVALAQMNEAISASLASATSGPPAPSLRQRQAFDGLKEQEDLVMSAIFKAVISIGAMDMSAEDKIGLPVWFSTTQVTMIGHFIVGAIENSSVSDLLAIQALLGIELYLYLSRLMRPAMHLSGVISKLAFEAGLHRCPERFANTFTQPADRQLRKRVFYSLYVLDRMLTAEFGIPIMLHDTDVDTCVPGGRERHNSDRKSPDHPARTPTADLESVDAGSQRSAKRPRTEASVSEQDASSVASVRQRTPSVNMTEATTDDHRLLPIFSLVGIQRLGGRAMELFNKSIQHRLLDPSETIQLRTDLDRWWNDMSLDNEDEEETSSDSRSQYSTLFTCLYHQHIIALSRPALSQSPNRMEHAHALQTAVTSARAICTTLHRQVFADDLDVFWPGYVDMVFFAALIMVYNAKREMQSGSSEANRSKSALAKAIKVLSEFSERWSNINSLIRILETLSSPLQPPAKLPDSSAPFPMSYPSNPFQTDAMEGSLAPDPFGGDFSFDFETFGINPDALWAFHNSIPGSPAFL